MSINYRYVKNIRFSCAYLFRIKINDKYLLVKDEQGRGTFQPVGGVYKYTDDKFFSDVHAIQCTRFGTNSDLDCDLRIIVPRKYTNRFKRWYKKGKERETPDNLYREFEEEILNRIEFPDPSIFNSIQYRYCGEHIEESRLGENDMQIRIADIVEFIPTPQQSAAFLELLNHESDIYRFVTKDEIYNLGRVEGNQIQSISEHTKKILTEEEKWLRRNKRTNKYYTCERSAPTVPITHEAWENISKADTSLPFTFISYNSLNCRRVWNFCAQNIPPLNNIWIDRREVAEHWKDNVEEALACRRCEKAILFISREYLIRSSACYKEASLIVDNHIPHIVILVDIDAKEIINIIKEWINCDLADKEKLRVFKKLFHYDDDTAHINCSMFAFSVSDNKRLWETYGNLKIKVY